MQNNGRMPVTPNILISIPLVGIVRTLLRNACLRAQAL